MRAQNVIKTKKIYIRLYYHISFPNISISIQWTTKHNNTCQQQYGLFYTPVLIFFTLKTIYLKYIKSLRYGQNSSLASQNVTKCFQIRIQIILFMFLGYLLEFIFCKFLHMVIVHLLRRWEGVVIYYKLIPNWIKYTTVRIIFTTQYRNRFKILLGEVFWK